MTRFFLFIAIYVTASNAFSQSNATTQSIKDEVIILVNALERHLQNTAYKPDDAGLKTEAGKFIGEYKQRANILTNKLQAIRDAKRMKEVEQVFNDLASGVLTKSEAITKIVSHDCDVFEIAHLNFLIENLFETSKARVIDELRSRDSYEKAEVFLPVEVFLEDEFPALKKDVVDFLTTLN